MLRRERVSAAQLTKAEVEDRIREVAARPGIGGYRKKADALLADNGIKVSHMTVERVLEKTPV